MRLLFSQCSPGRMARGEEEGRRRDRVATGDPTRYDPSGFGNRPGILYSRSGAMDFHSCVRRNRSACSADRVSMRVLIQTRTAGELDWTKGIVELVRLPAIGECVSASVGEGQKRAMHKVLLVVHVAEAKDHDAELYCNRLVPADAEAMPTLPLLLTIQQAARAAQVSERTIRRLLESGRLKGANYGTGRDRSDWRLTPDALADVQPVAQPADVPASRESQVWPRDPLASESASPSPRPQRKRRTPAPPARAPMKHAKEGKFLPRPEQKRAFRAWS